MPETVLYDLMDGVATITLNRPEAMNSLTTEMKAALRMALEQARDDASVRAVVLTGAGRAFCAGQDLREHAANLEAGEGLSGTVRSHYNPIALAITQMAKPVVAAVNGVAAGAGAAMTFASDFRVVADKARFIMAFAKVGLAPDTGMSWTLQRLVGRARATELLMLAEPLDASRAQELGLVTKLVPAEEVAATARELATALASGPTRSFAAIKEGLDYAATRDLPAALEKEAELQARCGATQDHRAATAAFLKKEEPVFEGR